MSRIKWAIAGALVALVAIATYCYFNRTELTKEHGKLATTYAVDTAGLRSLRLWHDSSLAGEEPIPRKDARGIVHTERVAADKVIATGEKRVANLEKQLRPGWLRFVAEADYGLPDQRPMLQGLLTAKVGLELRIRRSLFAKAYVEQPLADLAPGNVPRPRTYHVGLRQEFRIF